MSCVSCRPKSGFDIHALDRLFADHLPRLAHMRDSAAFANDLAHSFSLFAEAGDLLTKAALLHDVGYAPTLHRFGYHPLDGALFLEEQGEHPWIVEGVLRHSWAGKKAGLDPDVTASYARRPPLSEADWLVRAVTVADWRAAGVGGRVSFARRFQDIAIRNPHNPDKVRRAGIMVNEVRDCFFDLAWKWPQIAPCHGSSAMWTTRSSVPETGFRSATRLRSGPTWMRAAHFLWPRASIR